MLAVLALLFVVSAVYLLLRLLRDRDLLILASVSPAIVAALALGILLLLRAFRAGKSEEAEPNAPDDSSPK